MIYGLKGSMFKLTFAFLLLVPVCWSQCTSHSCGETDGVQMQMRVIMQRLDELSQENNKLKTNNQEFRTTIEGLETTIGELQSTIASQQTNIIRLHSAASTTTYFSVAGNTIELYNLGEAIKFPDTHTNVLPAGTTGGWNTATNRFTCPMTGDYMFVVTLWKFDGSDTYNNFIARLVHTSLSGADTAITSLFSYKASSVSGDMHFSNTMQAIVPCAAGEKVWVQARCSGCRLYDSSAHHNTFTGFKL